METRIKELLDKLNIGNEELTEEGKYYVITLPDYDEFVKVYNKLENSLHIFKNSLASFAEEDDVHVQYETEDGIVLELVAILSEDNYTLNFSDDEEKDN